MQRRNRSGFRAFLASPFTLVIGLIVLVLLARAAINIHSKAAESAARLAEAQANFDKMQANKLALSSQIADLSTDAGVEAAARERYHAVEPGESVAVIVSSEPSQSGTNGEVGASTTAAVPGGSGGSWWQRLLRAIGL